MSSQQEIVLKPIGFVQTKAADDEVRNKTHTSQLVLNKELTTALEGIEDFSHLFVLFWLDKTTTEQRKLLKVHPRRRKDLPLIGIFATRTMTRPNPIGLTLVELIKVEDNILTVQGLDAFNGTPVIDIKPFDSWDNAENAKIPEWWTKLKKEKEQK
jgi:tRNA-Thr(GGU) m(6)t(6)A37 methyltransferase TsaA